jgi:hypothetical protein
MPSRLRVNVRPDGMTLEDLFVSHPMAKGQQQQRGRSNSVATIGAGDKGRAIALTPRSAEACLMEGVDPHDLYDRDPESFQETGLDPAIVRMVRAAYA